MIQTALNKWINYIDKHVADIDLLLMDNDQQNRYNQQ